MVSVDSVKKIVDFVARKEQSGGYTPDQFNVACEMANIDLFRARYGLTEKYTSRPVPPVAYEVTQKVKDDMRVFKKEVTLSNLGAEFDIPSDYVHLTSTMTATITGCSDDYSLNRPVEFIPDAHLGNRMVDFLTKPTEKNPVGVIGATKFSVYPKTITSIRVTYLKQPLTPNWAYTLTNDVAIYNQSASTDFEWPAILQNDLARMVLLYLGVSIRDEDVERYARESMIQGV